MLNHHSIQKLLEGIVRARSAAKECRKLVISRCCSWWQKATAELSVVGQKFLAKVTCQISLLKRSGAQKALQKRVEFARALALSCIGVFVRWLTGFARIVIVRLLCWGLPIWLGIEIGEWAYEEALHFSPFDQAKIFGLMSSLMAAIGALTLSSLLLNNHLGQKIVGKHLPLAICLFLGAALGATDDEIKYQITHAINSLPPANPNLAELAILRSRSIAAGAEILSYVLFGCVLLMFAQSLASYALDIFHWIFNRPYLKDWSTKRQSQLLFPDKDVISAKLAGIGILALSLTFDLTSKIIELQVSPVAKWESINNVESAITSVAIDPDCSSIAAMDVFGRLWLWDIQSGQRSQVSPVLNFANRNIIKLIHTGEFLAIADQTQAAIYNTKTMMQLLKFQTHPQEKIVAIAISIDKLVILSINKKNVILHRVTANNSNQVTLPLEIDGDSSFALSVNGDLFAYTYNNDTFIAETTHHKGLQQVRRIPGNLFGRKAILFSRWEIARLDDGNDITGGDQAMILDLGTLEPLYFGISSRATFHGQLNSHSSVVLAIDAINTHTGETILTSGGLDRILRVHWHSPGGVDKGYGLGGYEAPISAVAACQKSELIASGSWDGTLRLSKLNIETHIAPNGRTSRVPQGFYEVKKLQH